MPINVAWVGPANAMPAYMLKYAHDGNAWSEVSTLHNGVGFSTVGALAGREMGENPAAVSHVSRLDLRSSLGLKSAQRMRGEARLRCGWGVGGAW